MLAITLSRRDFREADQVISFYTRDLGKLELIARGVKKIVSKNSAHLEPFSVVEIDLAKGKQFDYVTKVQPVNYFSEIRCDLQKSLMAKYVVELLNQILSLSEPDENIFFTTISLLEFLENIDKLNLILIDSYIVKLLDCLGFSILEEGSVGLNFKKELEVLESGEWQAVFDLNMDEGRYKKLHQIIYNFFVYQLEKKVLNWQKLAYFS